MSTASPTLYGPDGRAIQYSRPPRPVRVVQKRDYQAADPSHLFGDWAVSIGSADQVILPRLTRLRNLCRSLERDNPYVRRMLTLMKVYVFGYKGIKLEVKTRHRRRTDLVNDRLNLTIRDNWQEFSKLGNYEVTGKYNCRGGDIYAFRRFMMDGEIFIRLIRGYRYNRWNFAIQFLEADWLDHTYSVRLTNGNWVRAGIEFNEWNRPIAYWLDNEGGGVDPYALPTTWSGTRIRVDAHDIIHVGIFEREQSRSVPMICSAIRNLRQMAEYEHSTVVSARASASKMGFIERDADSLPYESGEEDEQGNLVSEMAAGMIELLQPGQKFAPFDPGQPNAEFPNFRKAFLRGIACSFDIGYNALASDLEGVNYSSLRHGMKDDVEVYRDIQSWWIELVRWRVFEAWLEMALLTGQLNGATFDDYERITNSVYWSPRGYAYVDPTKDAQADLLQVANKMETRTNVLGHRGLDIEEVFETLAHEEDLADEYGLDLSPVGIGGGSAPRASGGGSSGSGTGEPPANPPGRFSVGGQQNHFSTLDWVLAKRARRERDFALLNENLYPEPNGYSTTNGHTAPGNSSRVTASIPAFSN